MTTDVVQLDTKRRLRELVNHWRLNSTTEIARRFREICDEQRRGTNIPGDVYDQWLQMSAFLTVTKILA